MSIISSLESVEEAKLAVERLLEAYKRFPELPERLELLKETLAFVEEHCVIFSVVPGDGPLANMPVMDKRLILPRTLHRIAVLELNRAILKIEAVKSFCEIDDGVEWFGKRRFFVESLVEFKNSKMNVINARDLLIEAYLQIQTCNKA